MRAHTIFLMSLIALSCGTNDNVIGSCRSSDQFCSDYTGSQWTLTDVETTCDAANFSEEACSDEGLTASCRINEDQPNERIMRMYGVDETTAQATCMRLGGALTLGEQAGQRKAVPQSRFDASSESLERSPLESVTWAEMVSPLKRSTR
jgi:hypothetical protein